MTIRPAREYNAPVVTLKTHPELTIRGAVMKRHWAILPALLSGVVLLSTCAGPGDRGTKAETGSLVEIVAQGKSELLAVAFDRYAAGTRELPIGVFDSGIGGLTVLAAILQLDAYNNVTHHAGADGRPDFENERFVYLGDQANMPYGDYPSEHKTGFLRELILRDLVFLVGQRYWPSATAAVPRHDKAPVKAIVIACNTATAYGLETVTAAVKRWQLPVPVIGIIDVGAGGAIRAIAAQNGKGTVAVLATVGTCRSEGYRRAIARQAARAGVRPPEVIQQGCHGLAGAIEGDPSYIRSTETAATVEYRGPAAGSQTAPLDLALLGQYDFEPAGLLGELDRPATWRLNSVGNYIRYHTASLLESYRRSGASEPIGAVVLGCTHFPFYQDELAACLGRLRDFRAPDGAQPYRNLIFERPSFINPAELTARQLYETLAGLGRLIREHDDSALDVDEFYISVPNPALAGVKLAETGGFTYEYKYGREPGHFEWEYVKYVPMSSENLSPAVRETIRTKMPVVWARLVAFSRKSPRTRDLPEAARFRPEP
jgi:glutamate racemase